jgi:hypothetical protein
MISYIYINKLILVEQMKELTRLEFNDISDRYEALCIYLYTSVNYNYTVICLLTYTYLHLLVEQMKELTRLEFNDISDRYMYIYVCKYTYAYIRKCLYIITFVINMNIHIY